MTHPPRVPELTDPKLLDASLLEIQTVLSERLPWLDFAYGKAQRLVRIVNEREEYYPGVYTGGEEHADVRPNDQIGNFSFFDVDKNQEIESSDRRSYDIKTKAGLVFWFNYKTIYPDDWEARSLDNVRFEVLEVLRTLVVQKSQVKVLGTVEDAASMYPGYRNREVDDQFLMRPFGGFRVNLSLRVLSAQNC